MCVCVRLCELVVFCPSFLRYPAFLFFLSSLLARGLERGCIVGGLNKQNYKKNQKKNQNGAGGGGGKCSV